MLQRTERLQSEERRQRQMEALKDLQFPCKCMQTRLIEHCKWQTRNPHLSNQTCVHTDAQYWHNNTHTPWQTGGTSQLNTYIGVQTLAYCLQKHISAHKSTHRCVSFSIRMRAHPHWPLAASFHMSCPTQMTWWAVKCRGRGLNEHRCLWGCGVNPFAF